MNYIDETAERIFLLAHGGGKASESDAQLYRMYAVLCRAKGEKTTNEDVHDAWSAWMVGIDPDHRSLIPFSELIPAVQGMDTLFKDAIHAVARQQDMHE